MAVEDQAETPAEPEALVLTGGDDNEEVVAKPLEGEQEGERPGAEGQAPAEGEATEEAPVKPSTPKWMKDRIDRATRQKGEAERKAEAETQRATRAEEHAKRLRALLEAEGREVPGDETPQPTNTAMTKEQIEAEARRIADQRAQEEHVKTESRRVIESGAQKYGADEFEAARKDMVENFGEELAQRPEFFDAIFGMENGADAFYALAKDPDETARILSLSPARMGAAIAAVAARKAPARRESNAPAPIREVNGKANLQKTVMDDDISMDDFIRQREEQVARRKH